MTRWYDDDVAIERYFIVPSQRLMTLLYRRHRSIASSHSRSRHRIIASSTQASMVQGCDSELHYPLWIT